MTQYFLYYRFGEMNRTCAGLQLDFLYMLFRTKGCHVDKENSLEQGGYDAVSDYIS